MDAVNFYPQFRHLFILSKDGCSKLLSSISSPLHFIERWMQYSFILISSTLHFIERWMQYSFILNFVTSSFYRKMDAVNFYPNFVTSSFYRKMDAVFFYPQFRHLFILSKDGCSKLLSSISSPLHFIERWMQ